jgi:hypothetical protein
LLLQAAGPKGIFYIWKAYPFQGAAASAGWIYSARVTRSLRYSLSYRYKEEIMTGRNWGLCARPIVQPVRQDAPELEKRAIAQLKPGRNGRPENLRHPGFYLPVTFLSNSRSVKNRKRKYPAQGNLLTNLEINGLTSHIKQSLY